MIPYHPIPDTHLFGKLAIHPFGLLIAWAVISGAWVVHRRARELGLPEEHVDGSIHWVVIAGFIGAHVFEMLFYEYHRLVTEGFWVLFKFWDGISSYGGFLGALLGFIYYSRTTLKEKTLLYSDILLQGLVVGMIFGRLGCTIAFDHPGNVTTFPLAFQYANGIARHNLGFYEFLFLLLIGLPATLIIHRRRLKAGYQTAFICLLYAPVRFILDMMRATDIPDADTRYLGLTFAQYCSIGLAVFAIWLLYRLRSQDRRSTSHTLVASP